MKIVVPDTQAILLGVHLLFSMMRSIVYPHFKERAFENIYLYRDRRPATFYPKRPTLGDHRQSIEHNAETGSRAANPNQPGGDGSTVLFDVFHFRLQTSAVRKHGLSDPVYNSPWYFSKSDAEVTKSFKDKQMRKNEPSEAIRF